MSPSKAHADDTTEKQRRDTTKPQTENYEDPSSRLLSMFLAEAKEEDGQMTKNWTEDTGGVLVFTGLFSAIVASFITLSLPQLSPDSGNQTVALLTQLVNISSGAPVVVQNMPFKAPASIVRVNVMWSLSLILSLSCALLATLMQQWSRRYLDYAQRRGAPIMRLLIRAYILKEVEKFGMSQAVEAMPLILHTSVFLFFAGLIDYLFPINAVVAYSALGCVVAFAFTYAILTLLPNMRLNSPYRTPLSGLTFFLFQLSALGLFKVATAIEGLFHGFLLKFWQWSHPDVRGSPNDWPTKWRAVLEDKVSTHYDRFLHGLRWSVERGAIESLPRTFPGVLHWARTVSGDKKPEDFVALMPSFFDHLAAINASSAILSLMSEQPTSDPFLGSFLYDLLNTCLPGSSLLTEDQRKSRLRVCLKCLWYCVRPYNLPENVDEPLAPYLRSVFASPEIISWFQTEEDPASRLLGHCFGSLVVKKLANDMTSPTRASIAGITSEMACISHIVDAPVGQVSDWLRREGAIDLANVISLASGAFETLVARGTEGDVVDVFQHTLGILAEGVVSSHVSAEWDGDQVARFREIHSMFADARVSDVIKERLQYISDRLPPTVYVEGVRTEIPSPEPDLETTPTPGTSQTSRVDPVQNEGAPDTSSVDGISSTPTQVYDIV
ncbi:hypothetical protein V8E53_007715 [Lactarius tabidus]